jgi:hypothetical protein
MPRQKASPSGEPPSRRRPGSTPDARESQMIELADRLAERQLREGTASSQVITHYLKLGSSRERLEQEKLSLETKLVEAKTDQIASQQKQEELFEEAIKAMRAYSGGPSPVSAEEEFE